MKYSIVINIYQTEVYVMVTVDELRVLWVDRSTVKYGFDVAFGINSPVKRMRIKKFLIESGYLKYECAFCHIHEWSGGKLSLELDHINGIHDDNRIDNLRLLCPNCHSMTPTFSCKRGKLIQTSVSDADIIQAIHKTPNIRQTLIRLGLQPFGGNYDRVRKLKRVNGINQSNRSIASNIPMSSELIDSLVECGSISSVAIKYGVVPSTVRAWLDKYNLPSTRKSIRECLKLNFNQNIYFEESPRPKISRIPPMSDLLNVIRSNPVITTVAKEFGVTDNAVRKWMRTYGIPTRLCDLRDYLGDTYNRKIQSPESHIRGTQVHNSKLTESDVMTIRSLYATGNHSHRSLAVQFGVGHRAIGDILSNKTWVHVAPTV